MNYLHVIQEKVGICGGMKMSNIRAMPDAMNNRSYAGHYMDVGKNAEEIVLKFVKQRPQVLGVNDFRELRAVQDADVDCAIKTRDGRVTLAEIKSDYHLGVSGNVLFEVLRINHTANPQFALTLGWSGRTPAQYLLYYAPQVNKIYQCKTSDLRQAFQRYTRETRKEMRIEIIETDAIKTTIAVLIPYQKYCSGIFTIHDLAILGDV